MKKILVIGASTGGPDALELLFKNIPVNFPIPILIAQHLAKPFTTTLATRLASIGGIPVMEVENNKPIDSQNAYIVPGDSHFFLYDPGTKISLLPATDLPKPSIDMGLTSVAEHFGPGTIAVILSGMGHDGLVGARAVRQVGGHVITQDEETSLVYGMPKAVSDAGLSDKVLPLDEIVSYIVSFLK